MNAMTEQLARLETDRCRMESELQEEVRTVQLRQVGSNWHSSLFLAT